MEKPLSLTLLYTANIRGDLSMLPRMYTFLQRLKPAARQGTLLLDLGEACADTAWHCRETGGRSAVIVLDGMGYDAANTGGMLDSANRGKLAEQVTMGLVCEQRDWIYHVPPVIDPSIRATLRPSAAAARLQILMQPADCTRVERNALYLQGVKGGQVGEVQIDLREHPRVMAARIRDLPAATPPQPQHRWNGRFCRSGSAPLPEETAERRHLIVRTMLTQQPLVKRTDIVLPGTIAPG